MGEISISDVGSSINHSSSFTFREVFFGASRIILPPLALISSMLFHILSSFLPQDIIITGISASISAMGPCFISAAGIPSLCI